MEQDFNHNNGYVTLDKSKNYEKSIPKVEMMMEIRTEDINISGSQHTKKEIMSATKQPERQQVITAADIAFAICRKMVTVYTMQSK